MFIRNSLLRLLASPVLLFTAFSCQAEKQQFYNPYQGQRKPNPILEPINCNYAFFLLTIENYMKASAELGSDPRDLLNSQMQELYLAEVNRCLAVVDERAFQNPKNWCHVAREYHQIASNVDRRLGIAVNGAAINFHCIQQGHKVKRAVRSEE